MKSLFLWPHTKNMFNQFSNTSMWYVTPFKSIVLRSWREYKKIAWHSFIINTDARIRDPTCTRNLEPASLEPAPDLELLVAQFHLLFFFHLAEQSKHFHVATAHPNLPTTEGKRPRLGWVVALVPGKKFYTGFCAETLHTLVKLDADKHST